jgi:ATP-dependent DNA helicase RecG
MTPQDLKEIISKGENLDVEFKGEEKSALSDNELVENVVCLANRKCSHSGWLVIGVEDDGRITGARPRHEAGETDTNRIQALISNRTRPSVTCNIEVIELEGRSILLIEVIPSPIPIGTSDGKYLRRIVGGVGKPECRPFHFHEMQTHQADRGVLDYTALPVPGARWEDLDPLEFERLRRLVKENRAQGDNTLLDLPDIEIAKAVGAVEANHEIKAIKVLGLLLFGKVDSIKRYIPTHELAFQSLSGTSVETNEFFKLPLFRLMEEITTRFRARNREREVMVGFLRIGVPDYPENAFREAVANSLVHRDYTRMGAVHIQWHDDRLEISSPGGFPEGVRLENILVTPPRPRNPILADAFKRAGIVERTGRGIDTIFYEQLRNGRPAPSYGRSTDTDVTVVLPGGDANLEFVRLTTEESQAGRPLKVDSLLILNCLYYNRRINIHEASEVIQKPEAETRMILERLIENGLVETKKEGKARSYHLSAPVYRKLGQEAEYVRQKGYEPIQQEQMVIQFVQTHGKITRKQVSELCKTSSLQAKNLLVGLVRKGVLHLHGKTKGAYYTPAGN